MDFAACIQQKNSILMEGALGERLKREYGLVFNEQVAMARLIYSAQGRAALEALWRQYISIAQTHGLPFLATTPTRRANRQRVKQAGCGGEIIIDNVRFLRGLQQQSGIDMYVGGLMGCQGDAYTGAGALPMAEARAFHQWQAELFRAAGADFLYAGIMPTLPEAAGMAQAMAETGLPYLISFTIQANGRLIDGATIDEAIGQIDALAGHPPIGYMTNCVHPAILYQALCQPFNQTHRVRSRFIGIQANTSPLPYDQLDGSADLKCSEPEAFALDMLRLRTIANLRIFGGCCGTDHRHMEQVARRL